MIVISGRARLLESGVGDAIRAASTMATASRAEAGCIEYRFSIDIDDPLVVQIIEQWESAEALDTHFAAPHFASFSEAFITAVDGPAEFTRFEVSSSGPLFG